MSQIFDKKELDTVLNDLGQIGLGDKEARVYVALLELGEVGSTKIIRGTNLHRQFVYQALARLEDKNLVRHNLVKGRKRFVAQNPKILLQLLDEKKQIADKVVGKLESDILITEKHNINVFKGTDAFISNEFNLLSECPDGSEILVIGGSGDKYMETMGKYFEEYEFQRKKKDITVKYIGSSEEIDLLKKVSGERFKFIYKILPGVFTGVLNTTIYPHSYNQYLFKHPATSIIVRDMDIVKSYTDFYNTLWKMGK